MLMPHFVFLQFKFAFHCLQLGARSLQMEKVPLKIGRDQSDLNIEKRTRVHHVGLGSGVPR